MTWSTHMNRKDKWLTRQSVMSNCVWTTQPFRKLNGDSSLQTMKLGSPQIWTKAQRDWDWEERKHDTASATWHINDIGWTAHFWSGSRMMKPSFSRGKQKTRTGEQLGHLLGAASQSHLWWPQNLRLVGFEDVNVYTTKLYQPQLVWKGISYVRNLLSQFKIYRIQFS